MTRKAVKAKPRVRACYTLDANQKKFLDEIEDSYKNMYRRLRSDMLDDGIAIMLRLVGKYGPNWYYAQKPVLVDTIVKQIEEMS